MVAQSSATLTIYILPLLELITRKRLEKFSLSSLTEVDSSAMISRMVHRSLLARFEQAGLKSSLLAPTPGYLLARLTTLDYSCVLCRCRPLEGRNRKWSYPG